MAKLIGTGKDPRFPAGQDYDVHENDLQHHVDAGLGVAVEPGTEAYAVHRGYDTIAADPGEEVGNPPTQADYEGASRTASRVETTAFPGDAKDPEAAVAAARETLTQDEDAGDAVSAGGVDPTAGESPQHAEAREDGQDLGQPDRAAGEGEGIRGARAADKSGAEHPEAESLTGDEAPSAE